MSLSKDLLTLGEGILLNYYPALVLTLLGWGPELTAR
jgi:hypothetical protein